MATVRYAFKAITTEVKFSPREMRKLDRMLSATGKDFQKSYEKVTKKFRHTNSPTFSVSVRRGIPPSTGEWPSGRWRRPINVARIPLSSAMPKGPAIYVICETENDPIFYYLEVGADRHRAMSPDWMSMTRGGMGTHTFSRRGRPMKLYPFPVGYISPRYFSAHVVELGAEKFITDIRTFFEHDIIIDFFGRTTIK